MLKNSLRITFLAILSILFILSVTGCGGGGGDGDVTTSPVTLSGKLDTATLSAETSLLQTSAKTLLTATTVTDDVWVVAIDENGVIQASAQLAQPLDPAANFNLVVPSGHDYVVVFLSGSTAGPVLAVFMMEDAGLRWSVISLPAGMNDVDLGTITIDQLTLTAISDINQTLVVLLPPPETEYADLDGDLIPDDFDWDDDGDGFVDGSGESTSVYYSLRGGSFDATSAQVNFSTNELWLEGLYNTEDRSFTIYQAAAPRLFIIKDPSLVFQPLYPPEILITLNAFRVWMDSPVSVDKNGRMLSGNLRFSNFEPPTPILVSANPDVDGAGTPGYDITLILFEEVVAEKTLTWEQLDAIGDDPTAVDGYLAAAWLGLRGIEFAYQNAQQIMTGYEYCFQNRASIIDPGPVTVRILNCDTYPGDGTMGTINYTWIDENLNQNIEPGDSFRVTYNNCWLDDPDDPIDEYFNGTIELMNYYDVRQPFIYMGVESANLVNLTRTETVEDAEGAYTIDESSETTANSSSDRIDEDGTEEDGPALWIEFFDYYWLY